MNENSEHQGPGSDEDFRCGFIALAGRPNVGKSTLLNRMLREKIAITSRKPQTTRNRILGIVNQAAAQLIFLDTPGIHEAKKELNRAMVETALSSCSDADMVAFLIQADKPWHDLDIFTLNLLEKLKLPLILVINKVDLIPKPKLLPLIEHAMTMGPFEEAIPVSAKTGQNIDRLIQALTRKLPQGPALFPDDMITDRAERFLVAEMIREKVVRLTRQELPYATAVSVEQFEESPDLLKLYATIHVERDSQKGMVIGKKGAMLKTIGTAARKEIERFMQVKVFLDLHVRVEKNWSKDPQAIRRLGYREN